MTRFTSVKVELSFASRQSSLACVIELLPAGRADRITGNRLPEILATIVTSTLTRSSISIE